MTYPVPRDSEVLRSADLRALAWFGLERTGLGHRGRWGFFRPPGGGPANRFKQSGNEVRVRGLAMVSEKGLALVAANAAVRVAEGPLHASWQIPKDRNDTGTSEDATLHAGKAQDDEAATVQVPIGRIEQDEDAWQVHLDAPAFSLDALDALAEAWTRVVATVSELTERFVGSQAGKGLAGTLIAEAAGELAGLDPGSDPGLGTRILDRAVFRMQEVVRDAEADKDVLEQMRELLDTVKEAGRSAAGGATALIDALDAVWKKGQKMDRLRDWLRPRGTPLPCRDRLGRAGELEERRFTLAGEPGGAIAIQIESRTLERPVLWYALDKRRRRRVSLAETRDGFEAMISEKERGTARGLRVLCARELGITVCVAEEATNG